MSSNTISRLGSLAVSSLIPAMEQEPHHLVLCCSTERTRCCLTQPFSCVCTTATQTQSHLCCCPHLILITCPVNPGISNYRIKQSAAFSVCLFLFFKKNTHHCLTKRANTTGDQRLQLPLFAAQALPGPQLRTTDRSLSPTGVCHRHGSVTGRSLSPTGF